MYVCQTTLVYFSSVYHSALSLHCLFIHCCCIIIMIIIIIKLLLLLWNSITAPPKSSHWSTTAKFSLHWCILIFLIPSRVATPEFSKRNSKNDQITASNFSLKFKKTKKTTKKAVYFVRFAMFEVAITKKPTEKAAKTALLWQQPAFAPTSKDLNIIVCDSKVVKQSFLLQLQQSFWSILDPKQ